MIPWLQIYDKVHYGKWLPQFWSEMINLPREIEGSKMKAGWQKTLVNEKMLCAHIRSGNYINKLRATLHNICNMKAYESGHKENTSTRLKADELGVQDINSCIGEFNYDSFDPVNDRI